MHRVEYTDAAESVWDDLRATRWRPPPPASQDLDRQQTYVAALEQAEQLFRAAANVGAAARPLPLFYGLSQAGRANRRCGDEAQGRSVFAEDSRYPVPLEY